MNNNFTPGQLRAVSDLLQEGLDKDLYTGAALWASWGDPAGFTVCVGHTDDSRTTPVGPRTLFDLASLTKPVVTAPAVLHLVDSGLLDLNQSAHSFFGGLSTNHLRGITLFHLLTHTSGLPAWKDLASEAQAPRQAIENLLSIAPEKPPGTHYEYSCLGYIMLGLIVEAVSGEGLDTFARRHILRPMGMHGTLFNPDESEHISRTAALAERDEKQGRRVHDRNARALGGVSGNAGLFSSVHDLATFCHTITFARQYKCCLPPVVANRSRIFDNALDEDLGGHTLGGWFHWPNPLLPAVDLTTKSTVGHSGFTGTAIIADPVKEVCSVLLTNRVSRPHGPSAFRYIRRKLLNTLIGAIVW